MTARQLNEWLKANIWLLDPFMWAFLILMAAGAVMVSHGTLQFYSYLLPDPFPYVAVVILTGGIMLSGIAGVLDHKRRVRYLGMMVALVTIELFAQYLQGQATMMPRIREAFPNPEGVDLVTIVSSPVGRVLLPTIYLAAFSLIVVGYEMAFSGRVRSLMARRARINALRFLRDTRASGVRALVDRLKSELEQVRSALTAAQKKEREMEQQLQRSELEHYSQVEQLKQGLAQERQLAQRAVEDRNHAASLLAGERANIEGLVQEIARLQAGAPIEQAPLDPGSTIEQVVYVLGRYCKARVDAGAEVSDLSKPLRISPSVVSSWIKSASEYPVEESVPTIRLNGVSH